MLLYTHHTSFKLTKVCSKLYYNSIHCCILLKINKLSNYFQNTNNFH